VIEPESFAACIYLNMHAPGNVHTVKTIPWNEASLLHYTHGSWESNLQECTWQTKASGNYFTVHII